jgi:uncharacterized membrane protein YheB (UPF0754 family)
LSQVEGFSGFLGYMDFQSFFNSIEFQVITLIVVATFHGYGAAWLAVRMLFRPRHPIKLFGFTIFPQGMIPRHRERLANAIGKAVGEELVSQETVLDELFGKGFLHEKISSVVDSYTQELLTTEYPSLIESLPENLRQPVLEAIKSLEKNIGGYIEAVIRSEETVEAVQGFVERRVDEVLTQTVSDALTDETYGKLLDFAETRARSVVHEPVLEKKIREFIGKRVDDLANTQTPLGDMFTADAIALLKEKAVEQIGPIVHQLSELATEDRTKNQISALIKKEVHNYYENLPFIKKFFVSRDNLLKEVDDLVEDSLPKRLEETLKGDFFADEAENFIHRTIDTTLERPLPELIGTIAPEQLENLKAQLTKNILSVLRSEQMQSSISAYLTDSLENMRPQKIGEILHSVHPEATIQIKLSLANGLVTVLNNQDTTKIIHSVLFKQIDSLLHTPIGKLTNIISEERVKAAGDSLTDTIVVAAKQKLPEAIREFDIGNVVREKVNNYPAEKLESLVMSVAKDHLWTIELFGLIFGFLIGIGQAIPFYIYHEIYK